MHTHMQPLQDRFLALGVLMLMLIDFIVILVYTIVEGVQGNLIAIRIPNREKPFDVEGVGYALYAVNLSDLLYTALSIPWASRHSYTTLFALNQRYWRSPPSTLPTSVVPKPETSSWVSSWAIRWHCRSLPSSLPLRHVRLR